MNGVGLVLVGDVLSADPMSSALVHSLGEAVSEAGMAFLLRVVDTAEAEPDVYHAWHASGGPAAVVLLGADAGDARVALLHRLGVPVVALTHDGTLPGVSTVALDDEAAVDELVAFLDRQGYGDVLYVPAGSTGSDLRDAAFARLGDRVRALDDVAPASVTAAAVASGPRPAVVVPDAPVAVAVIAALRATGRSVPDDVGVLSWADSVLCRTGDPTITALDRHSAEIGRLLGECVVRATAGGEPMRVAAPPSGVAARESA